MIEFDTGWGCRCWRTLRISLDLKRLIRLDCGARTKVAALVIPVQTNNPAGFGQQHLFSFPEQEIDRIVRVERSAEFPGDMPPSLTAKA